MSTFEKAWALCLGNAQRALSEAEAAIIELRPYAQVHTPLIECVWWVGAADLALQDEFGAKWKKLCKSDSDLKKEIAGLRWAGERTPQQLRLWGTARPPFSWADAESLEPKRMSKQKKSPRRKKYEDYVQGRTAREVLKQILKAMEEQAVTLTADYHPSASI